jgi:hypothetical protein
MQQLQMQQGQQQETKLLQATRLIIPLPRVVTILQRSWLFRLVWFLVLSRNALRIMAAEPQSMLIANLPSILNPVTRSIGTLFTLAFGCIPDAYLLRSSSAKGTLDFCSSEYCKNYQNSFTKREGSKEHCERYIVMHHTKMGRC